MKYLKTIKEKRAEIRQDIEKWDARMADAEYKKICKGCKKEIIIFTQHDHNPEYYTYISVGCSCGDLVFFSLPVN